MPRSPVKFFARGIAAVCVVVALYCPWGYLSAHEPGQEIWLIRFPVAFGVAVVVGVLSSIVAAKV
jgi:hypothetical protein